ncbi:putative F-box protein At3g51171 [Primulina huaijiensis]|uniref:putative F-box protein At3g51171 n=1 Tax=Primulina huaijiensis TaxID=1492673 RepID=UPI003CC749BE
MAVVNGDGEGDGDGRVLPDAMVEDILSRLHSKVLMKLRIVCKNWKYLISTSYFMNLHVEKSLRNPNFLLLSDSSSNQPVITTVSLAGDVLDRWNLPLVFNRDLDMLPSQWGPNNLVCIFDGWKSFLVCNPSVRKMIRVPRKSCSKRVDAYGFCYLPSRNQYVIMISLIDYEWQMIPFSINIGNNLEGLRTGVWNSIKDCKVLLPQAVFANGVFYWIGLKNTWSPCLLCFDLYKEKFFTAACQDVIKGTFSDLLHNLKGNLRVMTWGDWTFIQSSKLDHDVMNQASAIYKPGSYFRPLMVGEDGEMLARDRGFLEWFRLREETTFIIRRKGEKRIPLFRYKQNMKLHADTLIFLS